MGCPLALKSLDIPRQIGYLNQLYEASSMPRDIMSVPIVNVNRLL